MKPLLWLVLFVAVTANVFASLAMAGGAAQLLCSIGSGLVVLGSGAGLWLLRGAPAER